MNRCIVSISVILFMATQSMAQSGNASDGNLEERLEALQWQKRVLILYAPDKNDAAYQKQKNLLDARRKELEERDLVQIELFASEADAATKVLLENELKAPPNQFTLLLIGKDGGVKYRTDTPAPVEKITDTIDAMPMRQNEMKQRRKPQ